MRITFVTTQQSYWGGSEVLWVRTAELAIQQGYKVQIIVYSQTTGLHPVLMKLKNSAHSFIELQNDKPANSLLQKGSKAIKSRIFPTSLKSIDLFNPDCLIISQAHNYSAPFNPAIYNFLLTFKKDYFLISQFNEEHKCLTYEDILKARTVFNKAKHIFFVSKRNKEISERQLAQAINNFSIIDNPLNLANTDYVAYPKNTEVINFASVARFDVNFKGQDILFQVLSGSFWSSKNWCLNLYGEGPDEQYLKELSVYYKINNKVSFKGHVADIRKVWENNHALLLPSIAEGKPLALEEAMICGRIAIASDVAGNSELIDDHENGFIASSFLPKPFNEALVKAFNEKEQWEMMGRKAHEKMISILDKSPELTVLNKIEELS